jgi:hypothetical protein
VGASGPHNPGHWPPPAISSGFQTFKYSILCLVVLAGTGKTRGFQDLAAVLGGPLRGSSGLRTELVGLGRRFGRWARRLMDFAILASVSTPDQNAPVSPPKVQDGAQILKPTATPPPP